MRSRRPLRASPIVQGIALALPLLATLLAVQPDEQPQDPTAPFPRLGAHAGKERCRECHEDEWDAISAGVHRGVVHGEGFVGCETCHGPGSAHAEDEENDPRKITYPPSLPAGMQTRVCVTCHRQQIAGHGGDPDGFVAANKGCTFCHTVHEKTPAEPFPGRAFSRRLDAALAAEPVGAGRCVVCHPLRDTLLQQSHHAPLASKTDPKGCETCHGNGSLHVETGGLARLITRPDRAADGVATCRSCHQEVDSRAFHWKDRHNPLLSRDLTCTSCHSVHEPVHATPAATDGNPASIDPETGQEVGSPEVPPTNRLCATCHAPAMTVLDGTIHDALGRLDVPLSIGCGACHAGAEQHARAGGRRDLVDSLHGTDARHQLKTCGSCHSDEPTLGHMRVGSHFRNDVTCLSCHSPAAPKGQVQRDAEQKCGDCHAKVAAEFRQPNHHPVPEGRMGCSDCHNPHSARPRLHDRELGEKSCVVCHKQYRGPFVFAHQASRLDGCVICHVPHGSSNRRMLQQANPQQNCLQCHADFPAFHDQTAGSVFTNCLNCHTEIHGSNHSRFLFR